MTRQLTAEATARDHTGRIGASRAAAWLGKDPRCTPARAWLEARGELAGDDRPKGLEEAAHWGTVLEDVVAREGYERATGRELQRVNRTLRLKGFPLADRGESKGRPALTCHLDRIAVGLRPRRLIQVKTRDSRVRDNFGTPGTDELPPAELIQAHIEITIADAFYRGGVACEDTAVLFGGNTFELFEVDRDAALGAALVEQLRERWQRHYVEGIEPEPMSEEDCRLLWKRTHHDSVDVDEVSEQVLRRIVAANQALADAKKLKEAANLDLRKILARTEEIHGEVGGDGKPPKRKALAHWRQVWDIDLDALRKGAPAAFEQHRTEFDAAAFAKGDPDAYADVLARFGTVDDKALRKDEPKVWARYKIARKRASLKVTAAAHDLYASSNGTDQ